MAASTERAVDFEGLAARVPIVGGSIVVVAVMVVGAASIVTGSAPGFEVRLPTYVLAGAVGFVVALLAMRYSPRERRTVLRSAAVAGVGGFAVATLGTEGVVYTFLVVASDRMLYAVSAAVVVCGLVYWSYRSWNTVDNLTQPW